MVDKEHFRDMFDLISIIISDSAFESIMPYTVHQIDVYRRIPTQMKYQVRHNNKIRDEIINELLRHRPNYQVYKIIDDIAFSEDGVIPALTL